MVVSILVVLANPGYRCEQDSIWCPPLDSELKCIIENFVFVQFNKSGSGTGSRKDDTLCRNHGLYFHKTGTTDIFSLFAESNSVGM